MKRHTITFPRLEDELPQIGAIRSVDVDHDRRMLILICDDPDNPSTEAQQEGATVVRGFDFTTRHDEEQ